MDSIVLDRSWYVTIEMIGEEAAGERGRAALRAFVAATRPLVGRACE